MKNNQGFTYAFGWNAYYHKVLGVCAVEGESSIARQRAWVWALFVVLFMYMPQTASLPYLWGDLSLIIDCLSTNMSILLSLAKMIFLQCQRKMIGSITVTIAEDWVRAETRRELKVMLKFAAISRLNSIVSFCLTNLAFSLLVISQFWVTLETAKIPDRDTSLPLGFLYPSYFPFDTTVVTTFVPLYIGQFIGTWVAGMSFSGLDCYVVTVVFHLCGQLKIVRNSLKNLVDETTLRDPRKFWQRVGAIVKRHEELNERAYVIEETFNWILLVQVMICSATFCFQGFVMFTSAMDRDGAPLPIPVLIFYLVYAFYIGVHLYAYCYVGDRLLAESSQISDAFYETAWYNLAPREAKAFLLICYRSKIPLLLKAGKFCTFSLQLFNTVLKNSMGYLSMLMAVKDRLVD